jgi:hypothetical protein
MQVGLCYDLDMAKIRPMRDKPVVEPPKPVPIEKIKSVQIVSEPQVGQTHLLQYISDEEGRCWRCLCGYVYPRPSMEVLLSGKIEEWLNPLVEEHQNG